MDEHGEEEGKKKRQRRDGVSGREARLSAADARV